MKETCIQEHTRTAVKWAGKNPESTIGYCHEGRIALVRGFLKEAGECLQVKGSIVMNAGLYRPVLRNLSATL
jgi:hypothetical protein